MELGTSGIHGRLERGIVGGVGANKDVRAMGDSLDG